MTDIDLRAREAARRLRQEVIDTVDLDVAVDRARAPRRSNTAALMIAALAVVALVAAAVLLSPGTGDVEVAVDEDEASTTSAPTPEIEAPTPIALGAPDDGKDSVGLPVSAEPSTGLVDGQTVTVSGSGFPPGEQIGVVMCTREAGAEHGGRGVDACNIGYFAQGTSDQQGTVSIEFAVRRLAMLDGQEVDCASEPGRCIIGMGMINDYDQSGGVAIDFDPTVPLPDPPEVTLSQTEDIADGQVVAMTVTGLTPNIPLSVQLCADDGLRCVWIAEVAADDEGTFDGGLRLWRNFGTWTEPSSSHPVNVDCAIEACSIEIQPHAPATRPVPRVSVAFDPERGARLPPTFRLADPGPFAHGDEIELLVDGVDENTFVDLQVCPTDGSTGMACFAYSGGQYDGGGTFSAPLQIEFRGASDPCEKGCVLKVMTYWESHDGTPEVPPPLFPEPIPILVTP